VRKEALGMAQREYKELSCREAGADCDFLVRAETEEEVLKVASDHAASRHGMKEITPELKNKMKSLMKSVWV
jgi:predicted small metal-binding protein